VGQVVGQPQMAEFKPQNHAKKKKKQKDTV
jgi:hypothetical protein